MDAKDRNREACERYRQTEKYKAAYAKRLETHREYRRLKSQEWREKNPEAKQRSSMRCYLGKRYGMTLEQYEDQRRAQGGVCAICGGGEETLHVDHCHATGKVRGLLCGSCNRAIGLFGESACNLRNAAAYLDYHQGEVSPNGPSRAGSKS